MYTLQGSVIYLLLQHKEIVTHDGVTSNIVQCYDSAFFQIFFLNSLKLCFAIHVLHHFLFVVQLLYLPWFGWV